MEGRGEGLVRLEKMRRFAFFALGKRNLWNVAFTGGRGRWRQARRKNCDKCRIFANGNGDLEGVRRCYIVDRLQKEALCLIMRRLIGKTSSAKVNTSDKSGRFLEKWTSSINAEG